MFAKFFVLITLMATLPLKATSFARVSLDDQLKEADSIFVGHFLEERSVQVEDGSIATQMVFKLSQEFGLHSELLGLEEIYLHYPGGTWEGQRIVIDGIPRFSPGERVAILAHTIDNRLWGLNLALGSYKILNYGKETLLVNGVFPKDREIGQIKILDFERKVKKIKGSSLKVVKSQNSIEEKDKTKGKNRSIASIPGAEENTNEETSQPGPFWLLVFLASAGALAGYRVKGSKR